MGGDLSFAGINLSTRGLFAAQEAINTAGHDIANANTEGFSRQQVRLAAVSSAFPVTFTTDPKTSSLGAGVDVTQIVRMRDVFLDDQFRKINLNFGEHGTTLDVIKNIEGIFNEPSDNGINKHISRFYDSWNDLAENPVSAATRANLRETGNALANALNETASGLLNIRKDLDTRIRSAVDDVNGSLRQLAELNGQISTALGAKIQPNNLMDQRDLLLDKVSKFTSIQTSQRSDGTTWVFVFGKAVVQGNQFKPLETSPNGDLTFSNVTFDKEPIPPRDLGGTFKALFDLRDKVIGRPIVPSGSLLQETPNGLAYQMDVVASKLAEAVNSLHRRGSNLMGTTGGDFFTMDSGKSVAAAFNSDLITAANIAVNPIFAQSGGKSLDLIAAGAPSIGGVPVFKGDNATALAIGQLRDALVTDGLIPTPTSAGKFSIQDFYRNVLTSLGVQGQAADKLLQNQKALIDHVENQRQSVSGVNLDEEMANMIKFQHTYAASARMINAFDQMLERIISMGGR